MQAWWAARSQTDSSNLEAAHRTRGSGPDMVLTGFGSARGNRTPLRNSRLEDLEGGKGERREKVPRRETLRKAATGCTRRMADAGKDAMA